MQLNICVPIVSRSQINYSSRGYISVAHMSVEFAFCIVFVEFVYVFYLNYTSLR